MARFRITAKDPDGIFESIRKECERQVKAMSGLTEKERATMLESRLDRLTSEIASWCSDGDSITIEFNTDLKTATVVRAGE